MSTCASKPEPSSNSIVWSGPAPIETGMHLISKVQWNFGWASHFHFGKAEDLNVTIGVNVAVSEKATGDRIASWILHKNCNQFGTFQPLTMNTYTPQHQLMVNELHLFKLISICVDLLELVDVFFRVEGLMECTSS